MKNRKYNSIVWAIRKALGIKTPIQRAGMRQPIPAGRVRRVYILPSPTLLTEKI